jgi:hypothetical protein
MLCYGKFSPGMVPLVLRTLQCTMLFEYASEP